SGVDAPLGGGRMSDQQLGTVVIGGSQAGLAVGYYLKEHGLPFVLLDENDRIGDAWRKRWDSRVCLRRAVTTGCRGCRFRDRPPRIPPRTRQPIIWRLIPIR